MDCGVTFGQTVCQAHVAKESLEVLQSIEVLLAKTLSPIQGQEVVHPSSDTSRITPDRNFEWLYD